MIDQNDPRLTAYALGELSSAEQAEIEQAIENSPELAATVEEIRAVVGMLGEGYAAEEKLALTDKPKALGAAEPSASPSSGRWRSIVIAASLAIVCVGGYFAYSGNQKKIAQSEIANDVESWLPEGFSNGVDDDGDLRGGMMAANESYDGVDLRGGIDLLASLDVDDRTADRFVERLTVRPDDDGDGLYELRFDDKFSILRGQSILTDASSSMDVEFELNGLIQGAISDGVSEWPANLGPIVQQRQELQDEGREPVMGDGSFGGRPAEFLSGGEFPLPSEGGRAGAELSGQQGYGLQPRTMIGGMDRLFDKPGKGLAWYERNKERLEQLTDEARKSDVESLKGKRLEEMQKELAKFNIEVSQREEQSGETDQEPDGNLLTETIARHDRRIVDLDQRLAAAEAEAALQRQKLGTGHPDYEEATAAVRILRRRLEEEKELKADSEAAIALNEQQAREQIAQIKSKLAELEKTIANAKKSSTAKPKPKSWKRVKAIPNTTRLMVGDKDELDLNGMQVNVQVDGFRARVLVDYFYYNDREQSLEGNFKLRLPDDSSLYYFAFGESAYELSPEGKLAADEFLDDGKQFVSLAADDIKVARKGVWDNVKESRMVPREKAAHAFRETVRRRVDPALVEWSGAGVFNAKVFPLSPKKLHRIVVGYDVNLVRDGEDLNYEFALPENPGQCRIEMNVQEVEKAALTVTPEVDPVSAVVDGRLQKRFVFDEPEGDSIKLSMKASADTLLKSDGDEGSFWSMQVTPDLPAENAVGRERAIFLVDTSLSSSPDKFNVWVDLLEQTLANNRDSLKEFAVVFFNVDSHFWKEEYVANTAENVAKLRETIDSLALEGATDLYSAIDSVVKAEWIGGESASSPDVFLLSDGAATWGETNLRLIDRLLQQSTLGSLYAYQTGLTGTSIAGLRFLAGRSGGAVFSVATEPELKTASKAHRRRPWKLNRISAEGATDVLTAGRVQWVYPGQTITVVGRGSVSDKIEFEFVQADQTKTVFVDPVEVESDLASRLYGQVAVGQLESLGSGAFDVSSAYARHFRVTGRTCSLLMLESEADYQRFDIKPQEDLFVIKTKAASELIDDALMTSAEQLADPKAQLVAWLKRLESMPGMKFKMPTALQLAMDDIRIDAISGDLNCSLTTKAALSKEYLDAIASENPDYDRLAAEALRRSKNSVDDAIKVYSSLVERNPGDIIVSRDVAFTAMELDRPGHAYHLLKRVAMQRPFQGNIYPAIGQCLARMGKGDMAIVYYEVAMNGTFQRQGNDFKRIVSAQYIHLLRQVVSGKIDSSVPDFAKARLATLGKNLPFGTADVVVTMMWNQDQTDVDLHVIEPDGEECFYKHKTTKSGGQITEDITTGFGPEMYFNANAPKGSYQLKAKYFGSGQNRTKLKNKVYVTIIRDFGTDSESVIQKTVQLSRVGEVDPVMSFEID
jgi:hypothetical protein